MRQAGAKRWVLKAAVGNQAGNDDDDDGDEQELEGDATKLSIADQEALALRMINARN